MRSGGRRSGGRRVVAASSASSLFASWMLAGSCSSFRSDSSVLFVFVLRDLLRRVARCQCLLFRCRERVWQHTPSGAHQLRNYKRFVR